MICSPVSVICEDPSVREVLLPLSASLKLAFLS